MGKSPPTDDLKRRHTMSRIKSKDTSIEVSLRKTLWHAGIRYRKNYRKLPGTPDIAITKHRIAIFCDGEFWHGKDWDTRKQRIQNNREYWIAKIERNIARDMDTDHKLQGMGWVVLHFWGNSISKNVFECMEEVKEVIFENKIEDYESAMHFVGD